MLENLKAIVESILFVADNPVTVEKLLGVFKGFEVDQKALKKAIYELKKEYLSRQGGIILTEVAEGYLFQTKPEFSSWVRKFKADRQPPLSNAALETLAIIAYRQPIIKSEIDRIRGVDSGAVLKGLLERRLIRIVGRKAVAGRPILYGTTKQFLELFNLRNLSELPSLEEMRELE